MEQTKTEITRMTIGQISDNFTKKLPESVQDLMKIREILESAFKNGAAELKKTGKDFKLTFSYETPEGKINKTFKIKDGDQVAFLIGLQEESKK